VGLDFSCVYEVSFEGFFDACSRALIELVRKQYDEKLQEMAKIILPLALFLKKALNNLGQTIIYLQTELNAIEVDEKIRNIDRSEEKQNPFSARFSQISSLPSPRCRILWTKIGLHFNYHARNSPSLVQNNLASRSIATRSCLLLKNSCPSIFFIESLFLRSQPPGIARAPILKTLFEEKFPSLPNIPCCHSLQGEWNFNNLFRVIIVSALTKLFIYLVS
jgi:hypothetical protein